MAENSIVSKSLWGFPSSNVDRMAPVTALREQGGVLYELTNKRLGARVDSTMSNGVDPQMTHTLVIFINGYPNMTFEVLTVTHPMSSFPATVRCGGTTLGDARSIEGYNDLIKRALMSERVQNAVAIMCAQAKEVA